MWSERSALAVEISWLGATVYRPDAVWRRGSTAASHGNRLNHDGQLPVSTVSTSHEPCRWPATSYQRPRLVESQPLTTCWTSLHTVIIINKYYWLLVLLWYRKQCGLSLMRSIWKPTKQDTAQNTSYIASSWWMANCREKVTRKGGNCEASQLEGRTTSCQSFWAVCGHFVMRTNCYFAASDRNSDIAIRYSDPDFLKESNNLAIRRCFHAVTLTVDIWPWTTVVHRV